MSHELRRVPMILILCLAALTGCAPPRMAVPVVSVASAATPLPLATPPASLARFREVGREAGLDYRWLYRGKRPLNILASVGYGCAFLDYDQDGNLDILLIGPKPALYRGDGKGHFTDVTRLTGLDKVAGDFFGCAVGDYDNDGFPDLYLSGYRTGILLHNVDCLPPRSALSLGHTPSDRRGEQTISTSTSPPSILRSRLSGRRFQDVSLQLGLTPQPWGTSCEFADVDGDGYLDLYVANYVRFDASSRQLCAAANGVPTGCGPRSYPSLTGTFFHYNPVRKRFADATRAGGFNAHAGAGLGVAFAALEDSGLPSLYVANDLVAGNLFYNRGHHLPLANLGSRSGATVGPVGQAQAGMGVDWGDFDNDGRPDLFVTTYRHEIKGLYHNEGEGLFTHASSDCRLGTLLQEEVSWGCKFFDADNDGWLDLLVTSGHVEDNAAQTGNGKYRQPLLFLHNQRGPHVVFADENRSSGLSRMPALVGRGLATGDYDNDGRIDALVVDIEGRPLLLHNETPRANWVGFRLQGRKANGKDAINRDAYGAVLTLEAGGRRLMQQCFAGGSYLSSSDPRVHFGLGTAKKADRLTVHWPGGRTESWSEVPINRYLLLEPGRPPQPESLAPK